jgi:hypothetical protein
MSEVPILPGMAAAFSASCRRKRWKQRNTYGAEKHLCNGIFPPGLPSAYIIASAMPDFKQKT